MPVVHQNDSLNTDDVVTVRFPALSGTVRYKSNDPSILKEAAYNCDILKEKYVWPYSSSHPSYDSAVVTNADVVGLETKVVVGLLLQMTVSGATGLPRRPEHSVKQHIRKKFDSVFKATILEYALSGAAYTAFVVPTLERFLFQQETVMDDDDQPVQLQPDLQFVYEVPDIFRPPRRVELSPAPLAGRTMQQAVKQKRIHRYSNVTRLSKQANMN